MKLFLPHLQVGRGVRTRMAPYKTIARSGLTPEITGLPEMGELEPKKKWKQTQYHWSSAIHMAGSLPLTIAVMIIGQNQGWHFITIAFACALVIAPFAWVSRIIWYRAMSDLIATRLIELQHCPACIADLALLKPAEDGCTICPECGAAWRLPLPKHAPET